MDTDKHIQVLFILFSEDQTNKKKIQWRFKLLQLTLFNDNNNLVLNSYVITRIKPIIPKSITQLFAET